MYKNWLALNNLQKQNKQTNKQTNKLELLLHEDIPI